MIETAEKAILDFYIYPPIGGDDWRYTFQTARVRALEMQMLTRATLMDMANADSFDQAADLLAAGEYALGQTKNRFAELENVLKSRRAALRELFAELCIDRPIVELFRSRDDFANLRLAVRRTLTGKPIGTDYSTEANVPPERFEQAFEYEESQPLPEYLRRAADQAVLAYYQHKDIRSIDYAIDAAQAQYNLEQARRLSSEFLTGLFKIQIDLTNIRTLLRLKFSESEQRNVFLPGGYLETERLERALELSYDSIAPLFFVTPYHKLVETSIAYLTAEKSFLKLEQQCDNHLIGFLKTTVQITAGPQPIIAYLLMKEHEIRTVRLILTAKRHRLETKLILDRI